MVKCKTTTNRDVAKNEITTLLDLSPMRMTHGITYC